MQDVAWGFEKCIFTVMYRIKFPIMQYFHGFIIERALINQMHIV